VIGRPRQFWLVSLAAVLGIVATLALGQWQMSRAAQKLAIHAEIEQRGTLPPLGTNELVAAADTRQVMYRRVVLRGTWDARHIVFLDNRQMRGVPGFYVVTPLKLDAGPVVLVERGWVQRNFLQRDRLPAVVTPVTPVEVRGRLAPAPAKLYEFSGAEAGAIRQNLDLTRFKAETGLPLLDLAVQQTGEPADGLLREWPEIATGIERHYGYAFQWWTLSALIAVLYAWFQFIAPQRKRRHAR